MGAPPKSLHALDLKGMVLENKGTSQSSIGSLWNKVTEAQAMRKQSIKNNMGGHGWSGRHRRALLEGSGRPINGIHRKVRTLKKLVPNGKKSKRLDGLFRDTTNYIVLLEIRVKAMKMMIELYSKTDD